jgi:hypothetical protein
VTKAGAKGGFEFLGARASNAGDEFHELWATRAAIRLLDRNDDLQALAVEGVAAVDVPADDVRVWDGVDCTLYFGGSSAADARHIRIEQLKYSAAAPNQPWTVSRLVSGDTRQKTVLNKLARGWAELRAKQPTGATLETALVSNQPIDDGLRTALKTLGARPIKPSRTRPPDTADDVAWLAWAIDLDPADCKTFLASFCPEGGAGSRFAVEERALQAVALWSDEGVLGRLSDLRRYVRGRMGPQPGGEVISAETVIFQIGGVEYTALFPCPPDLASTANPIPRPEIDQALGDLTSGRVRRLCLHGEAGVGKTTALAQVGAGLPAGSEMVVYDCYGGGRYLDSDALRHRGTDAFMQLTNELAARLNLPLLVVRRTMTDPVRVFANRLRHAAGVLAAVNPNAFLVIAVDAADNAIAAGRAKGEPPFIHEFLDLGDLPDNVRLVVSARTGRLPDLSLPRSWTPTPLGPFELPQTTALVARQFAVSDAWLRDFHDLTHGIPRVQSYALRSHSADEALDRLLPAGKSLGDVFVGLFEDALKKSGAAADITRICAGLIALPRPIPVATLAEVIGVAEAHLIDFCGDLAPALRVRQDVISFADEDFEAFVRQEGVAELDAVREKLANHLLVRAETDRYAAEHIASALSDAGRRLELLDLVEGEPAPRVIIDPVVRREVELKRLRLAIQACGATQDRARALKFVLIGAEGQRSEKALAQTLRDNLDLSVRFASGPLGRVLLSEGGKQRDHISVFYQRLLHAADRGDTVSGRESQKLIQAYWENHRTSVRKTSGVTDTDILAHVDSASRLGGAAAAIQAARSWQPRGTAILLAAELPSRLVAAGRSSEVEALLADPDLPSSLAPLLAAPLLLKGFKADPDLSDTLASILPWLRLRDFYRSNAAEVTRHGVVLDLVLCCCELSAGNAACRPAIDAILKAILRPEFRGIDARSAWEAQKLDLLFRAWALSERLAGREPVMRSLFLPRPVPSSPPEPAGRKVRQAEKDARDKARQAEESHDASLHGMVDVFSDLYRLRADVFVRPSDAEALEENALGEALTRVVVKVQQSEWRLGREHGTPVLRALAARSLLALMGLGASSDAIVDAALRIHGGDDEGLPNKSFVERLSLWPEQHVRLVRSLGALAQDRRDARIGAEDKSRMLMAIARYLLPLSADDAGAVFNHAIEAAAELDNEIVQQLELIDATVTRAGAVIVEPGRLANELSEVATDAGIRLQDLDHFPWAEVSRALAVLDPVQALAACARWEDADLGVRDRTLGPVVLSALQSGRMRPEQAAALGHLLDQPDEALTASLETVGGPLVEEMAWDRLIRGQGRGERIVATPAGPWSEALVAQQAFLNRLTPGMQPDPEAEPPDRTGSGAGADAAPWPAAVLTDAAALGDEVLARMEADRAQERYGGADRHLTDARAAATADRVGHLEALARLAGPRLGRAVAHALLGALTDWRGLPAVDGWRRAHLGQVIADRLPELTRYVRFPDQPLDDLLELAELDDAAVVETLLKGIEIHVGELDGESLFGLAHRAAVRLPPAAAASLTDWFIGRLYHRIPLKDREAVPPDAIPATVDEAVARYLFAVMGDIDVRLRWRAGHALRRLARLGDTASLDEHLKQFARREEPAFRYHDGPFYWLAAKQWAVMTWTRIASERPQVGVRARDALFDTATDPALPHLLIQLMARDGCLALSTMGVVTWTAQEANAIQAVGVTPHPRKHISQKRGGLGRYERRDGRKVRRFDFDGLDTLPYWYDPVLRCFATLKPEALLEEAERWILDVWGHAPEPWALDRTRRRTAQRSDWNLYNHGHGSNPTLEDLRTHLEWNALWTAAGGLLATQPLRKLKDAYEASWEDLAARARRELLADQPGWATDFRTAIPLLKRYWATDKTGLKAWVNKVTERYHRAEFEPGDRPEFIVVHGHSTLTQEDRVEAASVSSALVGPVAGSALVRALQMMGDSWDYKLPDEDEDWDIDAPPFRLLGWLARLSRDSGLDEKDPFRGQSGAIQTIPGRLLHETCGLVRDPTGRALWTAAMAPSGPPMFIHEAWGEPDPKSEWYGSGLLAGGHRLLAHREQLQAFLERVGMDLVVEVEIRRNDRESRRQNRAKARQELEGRYDRLYRLGRDGGLHIAEGDLGAWRRPRPTSRRVPAR